MSQDTRIWLRWLAAYAVMTVAVDQVSFAPELRIAHGVLLYLLLIIGASREGGWRLSLLMVVLGYVAVDFYFVPPRHQIGKPTDFDLFILVGFLATSGVIARLVIKLRETAALASARADAITAMSEERVRLARLAARAEVLQDATRLKDALLASVSHDLRSPVMSLMMLADPATGMAPADAMPRVQEQADRLRRFLTALDRFRLTPVMERPLPIETHPANDLVVALLNAMQLEIGARAVQVTAAAPPPLSVRCDFTLTLQVLGNLLQNALRYTPPDTAIEIGVSLSDAGLVRLRISDRGPGIAAEHVDAIFAPLRRGPVTPTQHEGSGMGLAIARTFARAQGGDVVYVPREGGGAHFDLLLPRGEADAPAAGATRVQTASSTPSGTALQ